jgi:adenosylcobinamide-phosphate synthase
MAGTLGLALAGPRHYASGTVNNPLLNSQGRFDARPQDIGRALNVLFAACGLHVALYTALAAAVS